MTLRDVEKPDSDGSAVVPAAGAPPQRFGKVVARTSVDNLLRTIQQHHVQLSLMADTKASILITISSIVVTIALSRSGDPQFRPALLTLAAACLFSLLLAVIAILPTFRPHGAAGQPGRRNLLFFGHFATMSEDDYMAEVERAMENDAILYETAVRDIHSLGVYLYKKKYRFLRFAYVSLIAGFLLATIVEAWAMWG
ncbi:MAG: Pycsar system effector family protein [Acidobacteriota bacterium]